MSNIIQRFVAGRAKTQALANAGDTVTRADFDKLAMLVNAMAKAVEGLIEDMEAATNPEKMQGVFNAALKDVMPALNAARRGATSRTFLAPAGDSPADGVGDIMPPERGKPAAMSVNAGNRDRKPLALPADRAFLAPKGD